MKAKRIVIALFFIAIIVAGNWLLSHRGASTQIVSGTVEADAVHAASRYGGRVTKILASEGDVLEPGKVFIELEAPELQARHNALAAALAELKSGPRLEEIAVVKHEWESAAANLELARLEAERAQHLFAENSTSEAERDRTAAHLTVSKQSAAAARERYNMLVSGTRPERITQAQAQLAEVEAQLGEMRIAAPAAESAPDNTTTPPRFILEVLNVKVGDVLPPNREVATLLMPQHLWVRVFVPEPWLAHIRTGQTVTARSPSFPDPDFSGTVEQINQQAEFTPRNVQTQDDRVRQVFGVKIRLPADGRLRPGMSVDVVFPNVPTK